MDLTGKVALVTGGARGIGAAEVRALHRLGAQVVVADVLTDPGEDLVATLGGAACFVRLDVTSASDWRAAVEHAITRFGQLDVLVNNAGIWQARDLLEETPEDFERLFRINTIGPLLGMQTCVPAMNGAGCVINVCSTAALAGYPGQGAYGASKWALRGLSRVAAAEFAPIRVNAVFPGLVDTPMVQSAVDVQGPLDHVLMKRAGRPEEVADMVAFLASDAATYLTGGEFVVDGGSLGPTA